MIRERLGLLALFLVGTSCGGAFAKFTAPAVPYETTTPSVGEVPEGRILDLIRDAELVVLGTPVDRVSGAGIFTPNFQLGNRETWYTVKIVVDSVAKGNPRRARNVDFGVMPAWIRPDQPFPRLAANEIVAEYPEVQSPQHHWGLAPVLNLNEQAVFIFKKCWNCLPLTGIASARGPYYAAHPLVAMTWGSKLPPGEWTRVVRLVEESRAKRHELHAGL
jgi:hypothetical protein